MAFNSSCHCFHEYRNNLKKRVFYCLFFVALVFNTAIVKAATYTWTGSAGAVNTNWNNPLNWSPSTGYPVAGDVAIIPATTYLPTVNTTSACTTLTISGATTLTMNAALTVSGAISIGAAATVTGGFTLSGATLTFTSNTTATFNANVSISGLTTVNNGNTPTASIGGSKTLTLNGGLTIGSFSTSSFTIAGTGTVAISGTTTMNQSTTLTNGSTSTLTFNAGSTLSMYNTTALSNSGNVNFSGTSGSGCTMTFNGNPETITNSGTFTATYLTLNGAGTIISFTNSGTWNTSNSTFGLNYNSSFTNTGTSNFTGSTVNLANGLTYFSSTAGTITFNACTVTLSGGSPCYLACSSTGSFIINNSSTIALTANTPYLSAAGSGSFTINGASTINISSFGAQLKNSGFMYAGTSNSACTINLNNQPSNTGSGSNIYNTGSFYLGSTSVINFNSSYYQQTINNAGTTFTLQSDSYGTAQIGALTTSSAQSIIGTFTVQRYFTGGSLSNRGYRLMSSPVNNTNNTVPTPVTNTFNFTTSPSLQSSIIITGPGGPANGFDPPAGWGVPYSATSVTILNYSTALQAFASPASLSAATPYVGTGFYFFFRGNNTANRATKLVKSGTYAVPEAVVASQTGYLNQGSITVNLNYSGSNGFNLLGNPYASTIDLTGVNAAVNVLYDAWMYDRTNNSCQAYDYYAGYSADPNITKYLASGEGFFVKATSTGGYVTFQESAKNTTAANQQTGSKLLLGIPKQFADGRIRLKLQQDSVNADFAMLLFNDSFNPKYDENEDVDDLNAAAQTVMLSSLTADNIPVAINKLPLGKQKTSSYLAVDAGAGGQFTFSKVDVTNISTAYDVWLIDHFANDSLNLRSSNSYTFTIDKANAATYGNTRFEVVIRKQVLPACQLLTFTGQRSNNANVLNWTTLNEYAYTTFTIQSSTDGKNFISIGTLQSDSTGKYTYTDKYAKTGTFYRLMQSDINDAVTYSNIIFIDLNVNFFSLYPNPATNSISFKLDKEVKSSLTLRVFNSTGTQVKSADFTQNIGAQDVSLLAPGIYTILLFDNYTRQTVATGKFAKI